MNHTLQQRMLPFVVAAMVGAGLGSPALEAQAVVHVEKGTALVDQLGWSVAGVGDVNGDGFDDFAVGLSVYDDPLPQPGEVRVVSGKDGVLLYLLTESSEQAFSYSLNGAGDVDNDGFPDIIVGSWQVEHVVVDPGSAFVYSGQDGTRLYALNGTQPADNFGMAVAGAGDINQDGHDDMLVGAPDDQSVGSVTVVSGLDGSVLYKVYGAHASSSFGGAGLASIGDINSDTIPDFVVGAPLERVTSYTVGAARVYSGVSGTLIRLHTGTPAQITGFGRDLDPLGDADDDAIGDYIVGAPAGPPNAETGGAFAFSGATGALIVSLAGTENYEHLGASVSGIGDIDGDGRSDALVGAPDSDAQGPDAGRVEVLSGFNGQLLYVIYGEEGNFGYALSDLGDVNGDGRPDFIVGAPGDDDAAYEAGAAFVFSSGCGTVTAYGSGCPGSGGFTPSLSASGCIVPLTALELELSGGLGGSTGLLFVGTGQASIPLGGSCTLLAFPLALIQGFSLSGSGAGQGYAMLAGTIPVGVPGSVYLQCAILDQGGFKGYSLTHAVELPISLEE